jgi:hypothetical protein
MNLEYFTSGNFAYRLPGELRICICCYCDRVCVEDYDSQPDQVKHQIHRLAYRVRQAGYIDPRPVCSVCDIEKN